MPRVSVITPVYNAGRWLQETLRSVRQQSFTDWEHVLADDCSSDNSVAIIERATQEDHRVRLLQMPENLGPGKTRNAAILSARGRYLAFLDADDLWLPRKLEHCIETMQRHGYAFAFHDYRHMSQDGSKISKVVQGPNVLNLCTLHTRRGYGGCATVVIDRQAEPEFHFPLEDHRLPEDFSAWSWMIERGHAGHRIPEDLARYRLTSDGRSSKKSMAALRVWQVYRDCEGLPFPRAFSWWVQYGWNAFWMYRSTRPIYLVNSSCGTLS